MLFGIREKNIMKLTLPVAKYNKLIDCLNKTNQTLDEVILQCNKDRLDSFKELDALEDSEVVKKVIERINANNEKFSYQKIAKEFKIDSFEVIKIHDYLEYSGYINNPSLHKKEVSNFGEETKEIEYELPQEIIGELDTYYEKFNLCRERLDFIDISNFINKNQTFDDDNLPEYLKYLVESIKTKEIRKEQVTISYIQRTFYLGFATAFKVKQYLEEKRLI